MTTDSETKAFTIQDAIKAAVDELAPEEEKASQEAETETSEDQTEETEVESVEEAETDETEEEESSEEIPDEEEPKETIGLPENWSDEDRQAVLSGDPKAVAEWAQRRDSQRESDYTKKLEPITAINKALEPFSEQIAMMGATPDQLVSRLLAAHGAIQRDPTTGILQLVQSYGNRVDLETLGKTLGLVQTETSEDEFIDPQTKALRDEVSQLKNTITQGQQNQQLTVQQQGQQMLKNFKEEANEDGSLKHPHFDKVTPTFAALLQANPSLTMEDAYDRAVMAEPELRTGILEKQRKAEKAEADKKAEADRKKKVTKAKASATKLPGKKAGSVADGDKPKSIKDFVMQAAKQVEGA